MFGQNHFNALIITAVAISLILLAPSPGTVAHAQSKAKVLQDMAAAAPMIDEQIRANPNNSEPYYMRGSFKFLKDDFQGALKDLTKARELGTNYDVDSMLANCYTRVRDYTSSLNYYNAAIAKDPNSALLLNNRGDALCKLNRVKEAFDDFSKALKIDPKMSDAYSNIGECYFKKGQYNYALQYLNIGIARDPKNFEALNLRGTTYQKLGKSQAAAKDFAEAKRMGYQPGRQYFHVIPTASGTQ